MPRLTPLSCKEIEKKLKKLGFRLDREDGSCRFYIKFKEDRKLIVQVHMHPVDRGIDVIREILRHGEITRDEWLRA